MLTRSVEHKVCTNPEEKLNGTEETKLKIFSWPQVVDVSVPAIRIIVSTSSKVGKNHKIKFSL